MRTWNELDEELGVEPSPKLAADPWSIIPKVRMELSFHADIFEQLGYPTDRLLYQEAGLIIQELLARLFSGGCRARILPPAHLEPDRSVEPEGPTPSPASLTMEDRARISQLVNEAGLNPALAKRMLARLGLEQPVQPMDGASQ